MIDVNSEKFGRSYLMISGTIFMATIAVLAGRAMKVNNPTLTILAIAGLTIGGYYTAKVLQTNKNENNG